MTIATLTARVIIAAEDTPGHIKSASQKTARSAKSFIAEVKAERERLRALKK